jgi:two-component system nitrate/nitrite response regulator NarL
MSLKVLLIDDHMLFREGLISLLQRRNIEVLGAVGDGNEGIRLTQELKPDIVLLDKRMPILDGISVLKHLKIHNLFPICLGHLS